MICGRLGGDVIFGRIVHNTVWIDTGEFNMRQRHERSMLESWPKGVSGLESYKYTIISNYFRYKRISVTFKAIFGNNRGFESRRYSERRGLIAYIMCILQTLSIFNLLQIDSVNPNRFCIDSRSAVKSKSGYSSVSSLWIRRSHNLRQNELYSSA